jgi:aminomuconate-semialdehyde/2-hydroxymuconate-6-semialdehyde dehydrogenase
MIFMIKIDNFINGQHISSNDQYTNGFNPSTGEVFYKVVSSDERDVDLAVEAAKKSFSSWSAMPIFERAEILNRIADLIIKNSEKLAKFESQDTGKSYEVAHKLDILRSAQNFKFFASAAIQFSSECHPVYNNAVNYTLRQPLGVVVCISPWNLPLYLLTWKLAPALASGNCVVAKPSTLTSMTAHLLTELCQEAGLPDGVLNIVYGSGKKLGDALCTHKDVKAVSFTGGTEAGMNIAAKVAPLFKKYSLEMGGKNAAIIFADCDLEQALNTTLKSSFSNQGQICLCTPRIFIEHSIYSYFREEFVKMARALNVGDPLEKDTDIGSLISIEHRERVMSYVKKARLEGGNVLCGGEELPILPEKLSGGAFMNPTVLDNLSVDSDINKQEIFGPVVTLTPFSSENEVISFVNGTDFGLASTLWTRDITRVNRLQEKIDVGIFWVNTWMLRDLRTPFGGMKNSGVGREGGLDVMHFFTETKNICIKY